MNNPFRELYDPKAGRKLSQIPYGGRCGKCDQWNGHQLDCSEVTLESMARMVIDAKKASDHSIHLSNRYWEMLQLATGKLAVLRHENNKLRNANRNLTNAKPKRSV